MLAFIVPCLNTSEAASNHQWDDFLEILGEVSCDAQFATRHNDTTELRDKRRLEDTSLMVARFGPRVGEIYVARRNGVGAHMLPEYRFSRALDHADVLQLALCRTFGDKAHTAAHILDSEPVTLRVAFCGIDKEAAFPEANFKLHWRILAK